MSSAGRRLANWLVAKGSNLHGNTLAPKFFLAWIRLVQLLVIVLTLNAVCAELDAARL